jgi:hypothetical protein
MKSAVVCLVAVAGLSCAARAQLMKMLVSTDGVNFQSSVSAGAGDTIQCLVTVSYTGISTAVAGFGSAIFQPTVSNWHSSDTLLPFRDGGNVLPADGSGMIMPQFYTGLGVTGGDSASGYGHIGGPAAANPGGQYVPGTYGRVLPMGRGYFDQEFSLAGHVHNNPDGSGMTYLRISQAWQTNWLGVGDNNGMAGVNVAQLYVVGRTTADPDFWGNRDTINDPILGWDVTGRNPANDSRRQNVEVFRFAFTLDASTAARTMTIDAPRSGQQGYIGYYSSSSQATPGVRPIPVIQTGIVYVNIPAPSWAALGALALHRPRRRVR